jgi:hypothetical protein
VTAHWTRSGERWRLLAPTDAVVVHASSGPLAARRVAARVRALPSGTPVVVLDHRPGGRGRARRIAATGVITLDRQYVALPSLRRAIVLAEDTRESLLWACRTVVTPPPGITWAHALADATVRFLRRYPRVAGSVAAGRVIVGRRS